MKDVLKFKVPEQKRVRMIVDTDCKNEADDQFALAHHLMTPMFDVVGINAAHFETRMDIYKPGELPRTEGKAKRIFYETVGEENKNEGAK